MQLKSSSRRNAAILHMTKTYQILVVGSLIPGFMLKVPFQTICEMYGCLYEKLSSFKFLILTHEEIVHETNKD